MNLRVLALFITLATSLSATAQFTNVAAATGTDHGNSKDGGVAWADLNNDGCIDLIINTSRNNTGNRTRMLLSDCNLPNPTFTDITQTHANGLRLNRCERSISAGDYNNDGYIDFCRNTFTRIEVYLNKGPLATPAYSFGDAAQNPNFVLTAIPGGLNAEGFGWMDYNNDGWLDLIIENHQFGIDIYENPADGTSNFFHVTPNGATKGLPTGAGTTGDYMTLGDYDDDGDVDIFARKQNDFDIWTNSGAGTFSANATFNQNASNGNKGGVLFCDFDNDGDFDLFWTDQGVNEIFLQTGVNSGIFAASGEPATSSGVAPSGNIDGCSCGDVDNDGDMDLFLGANSGTSFLYLNNGGMSFTRNNLGINANGNTEGHSFGDYDNDGDLDLYININNGSNQLWRNSTNDSNYLKVFVKRDLGGGILRDDLGATAVLKDCAGNIISGIRQVSSVKGHGSNNPAVIHFGIPSRDSAYVVEVRFTTVGGTRLIIDSAIVPALLTNQIMTIISPTVANSLFDACLNVLPIKLLGFNAYKNKNTVDLKWVTATEINNDYFVIERSIDTKTWEPIITRDGAGNSNNTISYLETDFEPLNGISYYRLKQTDFDGKFSYSKIEAINFEADYSEISIYPNPTENKITIKGDILEISKFRIFDMLGKDVSRLVSTTNKSDISISVDLTNLASGVYTIRIGTMVNKLYKK